jgi:DNA invertase Pin-like site-specific DNA recombinase
MSLASQQFSINHFREKYEMGIHAVLQSVGSAFSKPQTDILNLIKSSKNKVVIVYEPNRLSRSVENFKKMWDVCRKNKHKIGVVTLDRFFDPEIDSDYDILLQLIVQAESESRDMGRRISRTMQYKKSREAAWGFMRDEMDEIVANPHEQKINKLIQLLGRAGSSIAEIRALVEELGESEGVEPFEIVECEGEDATDITVALPYAMDVHNIRETLKIYGIRHRKRLNWEPKEIVDILKSAK